MVVFRATFIASGTSLFGSFSRISGRSPTTNARGLLTPHLLTARMSYWPGGTVAATVTLNFTEVGVPVFFFFGGGGVFGALGSTFGSLGSGGMIRVALRPGCVNRSDSVSSRSVPVSVTSATVVPDLPPAGERISRRGNGRPGFCWAIAAVVSEQATTHQRNRLMGTFSGKRSDDVCGGGSQKCEQRRVGAISK